jgi:DNA/RNA endonuclease YhcR with UshA esterase domain
MTNSCCTRSIRLSFATLLAISLFGASLFAQKKLTTSEAKEHIGETATVCGTVVSARYAASTKGQPTFLNLDRAYPGQVFTVLIWGSDRAKFVAPETDYRGKRICATGKITEYRGVPEIIASEPRQIQAQSGR